MVKKELTLDAIRKKTLHDSFLTMLNASILWPEKWDIEEVLGFWWGLAFPDKELTEEELNENTIDNIRLALLKKGGFEKPVLTNTKRVQLIKESISFSEEE